MKKLTLMALVMLFSCFTTQHTHAESFSLITNGDGSTDDVSCFFATSGAEETHAQMDGNTFKVEISAGSENMWEAQFAIKASQKIPAGTFVRFKTMVKCTDTRECYIQAHRDILGNYVHWSYLGYQFTTKANEWIEYEWMGTIPEEADDCDVVCINFGTSPEAATIWFKDIEWEITKLEEINEGVIATFYGASEYGTGTYLSYTDTFDTNMNIDGTKYLSLSKTDICDEERWSYFTLSMPVAYASPLRRGKTYKISFDVIGTPAENMSITFGPLYQNPLTTNYDITSYSEWQRVTKEVTIGDYDDVYDINFLFGKYQGTLFITNIFIYDALDTPELPELPTLDISKIALRVIAAVPVAIGSSQSLAAAIQPESASSAPVIWVSNDESIATVDENGVVTGISKGLTYIRSSIPYLSYGSSIAVYVHDDAPAPVSVSSITIDPMVIDKAVVGDKIQLEATVLPENADDKTVTWSSSNENAATVDADGLVTITAPGTAVIAATANDGSGVKGVCLISGLSGLDNVTYTSAADKKDVYSVDGKLIMRSATRDDLNRLSPGIYLIGDQKIAIR